MKKIIPFFILVIFTLFFNANANECTEKVTKETKNVLFQGSTANFEYEYCEYSRIDSMQFDGKQLINIKIDDKTYSYVNHFNGVGYFSGDMFFSELGVFGLVASTTGNEPFSMLYFTILDNQLVLLGKLTFEQKMGAIVGEPYVESKNSVSDFFIKKILDSKREYIWGEHPLSFYEGLLFILSDELDKNMTISEFSKLSYKLSNYPDLVNFYRQKIFFKNSSLCIYNENMIEMDAFGCRINNKQLSICYNYFENSGLIYRYGDKSKLELELSKRIQDNDMIADSFIFEKNKWQYIVNTNLTHSGISIKKDGQVIAFLECDIDTIKHLILEPIWKETFQ